MTVVSQREKSNSDGTTRSLAATDSGVSGASSMPVLPEVSRLAMSTQRMNERTSSPRWFWPTVWTQVTPVSPPDDSRIPSTFVRAVMVSPG